MIIYCRFWHKSQSHEWKHDTNNRLSTWIAVRILLILLAILVGKEAALPTTDSAIAMEIVSNRFDCIEKWNYIIKPWSNQFSTLSRYPIYANKYIAVVKITPAICVYKSPRPTTSYHDSRNWSTLGSRKSHRRGTSVLQ